MMTDHLLFYVFMSGAGVGSVVGLLLGVACCLGASFAARSQMHRSG